MTDWLLGTLLATSGLIVLVLLVREPVRRLFGARVAYGLWLVPAARLLMPTLTKTEMRPAVDRAPLIPPIPGFEPSHVMQDGVWPLLFIALWAAGAVILFAVRMLEFRRQRSAILKTAAETDRVGSIRIVRSAAVRGPVAFGILDRVIAVPADFEARYSAHERGFALDHELAHHHSGDLIANYFAFILLCLQWFNPLAWAAHAAFRFDQEAACDARVLDKASRNNRVDYGRAIAKAASGRTLLFAGALDQRSTLHRRLKCMKLDPSPVQRLAGRLIIVAAIGAALPLTATRAFEYVDAPRAPAPQSRATITTFVDFAPTTGTQPTPGVTATNRGHRVVLARDELVKTQPENGAAAMQKDREQALRDIARDQVKQEQAREGAAATKQNLERDLRNAERAQRDQDQIRWDAEQVQRNQEQSLRDVAQAQRNREQILILRDTRRGPDGAEGSSPDDPRGQDSMSISKLN